MTKVVAPGALDSSSLQIRGGAKVALMAKRKTPSELRGEQLKRINLKDQANDSADALHGCKSTAEMGNGFKKQEQSKNPRCIEMRIDESFPVKKARSWLFSGNSKENNMKESSSTLKDACLMSNVAANKREQLIREQNNGDVKVQDRPTIEKLSQSRFRSITELSTGGEDSSSVAAIDMNKALKALATCKPLPCQPGESAGECGNPSPTGNYVSEFNVPGQKIPLDLSLKTFIRFVSSSPVYWLQESMMSCTYNGTPQLKPLHGDVVNHDTGSSSRSAVVSQVSNPRALHSWVHPESILPPSIISAMIASRQDSAEADFLRDRHLAWGVSFRSLYFMFRENICNIFYVCTSEFVAMFIASNKSGDGRRSCNGYITQSTRKLRSLLKTLDVRYSMPLCKSKIEQVATEDLDELSELEKHNIGQTRHRNSISNIDNTPESLLAFVGNLSVHGLYDLLLNHRALGLLPTSDVPLLYSPVPFQRSTVSPPEIKCSEMVRMEHIGSPSGGRCCMVEIKGMCLPPWIISNLCSLMSADGRDFDASLVTKQPTAWLNIALSEVYKKPDLKSPTIESSGENKDDDFHVPGAIFCPQLQSGQLKSLKYSGQSYMASLSPL